MAFNEKCSILHLGHKNLAASLGMGRLGSGCNLVVASGGGGGKARKVWRGAKRVGFGVGKVG